MNARTVTVLGVPIPKGSMTVVNGRLFDRQGPALKSWQRSIVAAIQEAQWVPILVGPVAVRAAFVLPRPQAHYRTGRHAGAVKDGAPVWHPTRPDLDKLLRAVLDSLTQSGAVTDDGQVAIASTSKHYGEQPAVRIHLSPIESGLDAW